MIRARLKVGSSKPCGPSACSRRHSPADQREDSRPRGVVQLRGNPQSNTRLVALESRRFRHRRQSGGSMKARDPADHDGLDTQLARFHLRSSFSAAPRKNGPSMRYTSTLAATHASWLTRRPLLVHAHVSAIDAMKPARHTTPTFTATQVHEPEGDVTPWQRSAPGRGAAVMTCGASAFPGDEHQDARARPSGLRPRGQQQHDAHEEHHCTSPRRRGGAVRMLVGDVRCAVPRNRRTAARADCRAGPMSSWLESFDGPHAVGETAPNNVRCAQQRDGKGRPTSKNIWSGRVMPATRQCARNSAKPSRWWQRS